MARQGHPWDEQWTLGERLGKGGQGLTHLATRKGSASERGALKILRNNKDAQARGRMHREVVSLEVLSSAGGAVPRVLDHNTQDYLDPSVELFVVMEYVPGRTLREVVEGDGRMSVDLATRVTLKICETIELAHTFPILHRDLKPENVIARDVAEADIVIVDYGLSFNAEDPDVTATDETFRNRFLDLPETNTPGGNRRDSRSDITAACAIYYYLLTGHVPGQLQGGDGRLPHLRPGYSLEEALGPIPQLRHLQFFFNRGFAPNVDSRFQTAGEFRERIGLITESGAEVASEDPRAVAQRASAMLRQHDRTTQIQEFRGLALTVLNSLQKFAGTFQGKLGRFMLSLDKDPNLGRDLPTGLDRVVPYQLRVQLNPEHHNSLRIACYSVASRGEQCVIVRRKFARDGTKNKVVPIGDYEELVWYDASSPPDIAPAKLDIEEWLGTSILELTDSVLGQ